MRFADQGIVVARVAAVTYEVVSCRNCPNCRDYLRGLLTHGSAVDTVWENVTILGQVPGWSDPEN